MKRYLSLILGLLFIASLFTLIGCSSEGAEAYTSMGKPELKFRDISFGTTYKDDILLLENSGLSNIYFAGKTEDDELNGSSMLVSFDDVDVAGYEMTPWFNFRRESADNSNIDDSIFFDGHYTYRKDYDNTRTMLSDYNKMANDLTEKLVDIYGDYNDSYGFGTSNKLYDNDKIKVIWNNFKDNATVELIVSYSTFNNNNYIYTTIHYKSGKEEAIEKEISKALSEAKAAPTPTPTPNKNGL